MLTTSVTLQMSQFHWHISDSQSFPLEVEVFPELASKGAYSANEIYTLHDIQTIVQYANEVSPPKGFFCRYPQLTDGFVSGE